MTERDKIVEIGVNGMVAAEAWSSFWSREDAAKRWSAPPSPPPLPRSDAAGRACRLPLVLPSPFTPMWRRVGPLTHTSQSKLGGTRRDS
jgi:hypothetical protein